MSIKEKIVLFIGIELAVLIVLSLMAISDLVISFIKKDNLWLAFIAIPVTTFLLSWAMGDNKKDNSWKDRICLDDKHNFVIDGHPNGTFRCLRCNLVKN